MKSTPGIMPTNGKMTKSKDVICNAKKDWLHQYMTNQYQELCQQTTK
ncbi:5513_t:CDS:2 [Gigaspora margarita]|uniref:5513_t:CDS:1 n=1 Tax=Gigaspora margarita TaxID=4874 RepID=A0ABM8VVT8_GIGMA|nr:5513_t:CDS:2 [Gigaspora margarita]